MSKTHSIQPTMETLPSSVNLGDGAGSFRAGGDLLPNYVRGLSKLNNGYLESIHYRRKIRRIKTTAPVYRKLLERDFKELVLSYLFGNFKTVVVLAGSVMETLLLNYLSKKKIKKVRQECNYRKVNKGLLDSTLANILIYCEEEKLLPPSVLYLGHVSRVYRNLIHPGKEISYKEPLDATKAQICFLCVLQAVEDLT